MLVQDYIACMIKINDYLEEFLLVIAGGNATKLLHTEPLDLQEYVIPIKWQRQMQVQNFEPTARTLHDFQDFWECLESALDDPPADNRFNKMSGQEKSNKTRCHNNNTNKDKNYFCMLHGHNYTQHQAVSHLKKGSKKTQKRS